uniref:RING-type E3 ubiquitin transferase n=1 Tax=Biomphalaria glabrata TaxID=6526 RepID=A0A2C9LU30_BIOGL
MSLLNNSPVQPSEILISSEDEDEIQTHHRHTSVNEIRSIRSLINQARMLLVKAEAESRPEPYRTEMTSIYKYSFSSNVKVNDLFRDHEMTELLNIMSLLKSRLSAEHVFALGCPQHPEERKIYDELVMHYSDQLLETLGNVSDSSLPPQEGRESVFHSNLGLSNNCSVCLEPWTTGGEHRVTCLKCGHLFGMSFKEEGWSYSKLHTTTIVLGFLFWSQMCLQLSLSENVLLNSQSLVKLIKFNTFRPSTVIAPIQQACNPSSQSSQAVSSNKRYHQFKKINIAQDANCRVFEYSRELGMVVVSQKSTNALFRGYGIKMFSRDLKPLSYQPLHSGAIRDMCFRPASYDGQLLSCGLDKSIQLTSVTSKVVIQKYTVSSTVWCCAWNTGNTNLFYAGLEKGVVREFDIRMTNTHVQDIMDSGGCPISNIQYWNSTNNSTQGLLIAQLQNVTFKQHVNDQYTTHVLPAMQTLQICSLTQNPEENTFSLNRQAVWDGGNMQVVISRNALISHPESDNDLLAVTANHCNNLVSVWDVTKKQELQSLPCYDKAIDIKAISHNGGDWLGVLTEKDLVLYKWRE